jgi:LPS-assembly protein
VGRAGFIYLEADSLEFDQALDEIHLIGNAALRKDDTYLETDRLIYHKNRRSADLKERIYLEQPGLRITGDEGRLELDNHRGWLSGVDFRLPESKLRGSAERAEVESKTQSRYRRASFTSCPPGRRDWSIGASELELDRESGWGDAYHAVLRLGGLPVFYSPYFTFPIDERRKSGLLLPSWGSSSSRGSEFSIPYYFNLAPNYDATLTPRWMSRRGTMLGGEFRFLGEQQSGILSGEILDDKVESEEHDNRRSAINLRHRSHPTRGLTTRIDFTEVSDMDYLNDFSTGLISSSARNLERIGEVNYRASDWQLNGLVQDFQTVDKNLSPASYPYRLVPKLSAIYGHLIDGLNTDLVAVGEYSYFKHDSLINGQRLRLVPSASLQLRRPWGHLTPRLALNYASYQLDEVEPELQRPSFLVPTLSLDSGLAFERESSWFGSAATHTLEPRLFYLYAPYEDQSEIPDFDTADLDLSFANLFKENRFSGGDRVGDANQLTLAVTTRWLEEDSGLERLRASIGQILYFQDRLVQLTGEPEEQATSAVAAELSSRLGAYWRSSLNLRWDPNLDEKQIDKGRFDLHYKSPDQQLFNFSYNYNTKSEIEDLDLSFYWHFDYRFAMLGDWKYSLFHARALNKVIGFEYAGRCCWSLRAIYQQYVNETDLDQDIDQEYDTRFMLQLELRGLGALGDDPQQTLKESIYGYQPE